MLSETEDALSIILVMVVIALTLVTLQTTYLGIPSTNTLIWILCAISFGLLFIGLQIRGLKK
jgi:amino acid transporter